MLSRGIHPFWRDLNSAILIIKLFCTYDNGNNISQNAEKNLDSSPDETPTFEKGKIDVANLGDITIGRAVFEPGWSWEKCVKPIAKTSSCQAPHTMYVISGRMKNGTEGETGPGDTAVVPPGHNAWVVGKNLV
jgi:hypothetical protein